MSTILGSHCYDGDRSSRHRGMRVHPGERWIDAPLVCFSAADVAVRQPVPPAGSTARERVEVDDITCEGQLVRAFARPCFWHVDVEGVTGRVGAAAVGGRCRRGLEGGEVLEPVESEDDEQAARRAAHVGRRVGDFRMGLLALPVDRGI
jgi:hypothetical protein